jgi:hypothetical protein
MLMSVIGCKKAPPAPPPSATTRAATAPTTALAPEPPAPVASPQAIRAYLASAQPFIARLDVMNQTLMQGLTLNDYRQKIADLKAALAAVNAPPPESYECQLIMTALHDAIAIYEEAAVHWLKAVPDPQAVRGMRPEQIEAYKKNVIKEAGYRDNCFQSAIKSTTKAKTQLDALSKRFGGPTTSKA